jgi:drug/metabolite transporter (DMT)-like permease
LHCLPFLFFQAAFGYFLFGEALSGYWWLGTSLIVVGIAWLGQEEEEEDNDGNEDKQLKSKKTD